MFKIGAIIIVSYFTAKAVGGVTLGVTCRLSARRALRSFAASHP